MVKYGQGNTMILPLEAHDVSRVRGQFWVYAAHKSGLRRSSSWLLIASSRTYCEQCLQCFLLSQSFILSFGTAFYTLLCFFFNACRVYKPALDTCFYIPMHLAYSGMVDL